MGISFLGFDACICLMDFGKLFYNSILYYIILYSIIFKYNLIILLYSYINFHLVAADFVKRPLSAFKCQRFMKLWAK